MPLANSNIYTKNPSETLFFSVFLLFFRQQQVQNTGFCSVFNALAVRNRFWSPPPAFSVAVCPPIRTPSPPKRCGRIFQKQNILEVAGTQKKLVVEMQEPPLSMA